ncbi:5004_t:CDS:1, partial [Dentiscutata heterogama]
IVDYFAKYGISLKIKGEFDMIDRVEFLSKQYYSKDAIKEYFEILKMLKNVVICSVSDEKKTWLANKFSDYFIDIENLLSYHNKKYKIIDDLYYKHLLKNVYKS